MSIVMVNCHIMAPFTVTQQQDTRKESAYIIGVDGYLQGQCSNLTVYLLT